MRKKKEDRDRDRKADRETEEEIERCTHRMSTKRNIVRATQVGYLNTITGPEKEKSSMTLRSWGEVRQLRSPVGR